MGWVHLCCAPSSFQFSPSFGGSTYEPLGKPKIIETWTDTFERPSTQVVPNLADRLAPPGHEVTLEERRMLSGESGLPSAEVGIPGVYRRSDWNTWRLTLVSSDLSLDSLQFAIEKPKSPS